MSMPVISPLDFTSESMIDESLPVDSPMKSFYRDKTIFITGGTGFLGQLFIEKLLRCKAKEIYVLVRPKRTKSPEERIQETFAGEVFVKLKSVDRHYIKKIKLVEGDTSKADLGISEGDRQTIIDNVEIVIHSAAEVRFDKPLQELAFTNIRGTKALVALVEQIKNLVVFGYISTAYSQFHKEKIEEKFYPPAMDPDEMIRIAEYFDKNQTEELGLLTEKLIRPWKNTYVFTKSLAEEVVRRSVKIVPTVVIRPSIIISTYEDPIPGWTNSVYGMNGMSFGGGLGIIRVIPCVSECQNNVVCADYVTNGSLTVIWAKAKEKKTIDFNTESKVIYQITSQDPLLYGNYVTELNKVFIKFPSTKSMWVPSITFTKTRLMFNILSILYHFVPAFAFDVFFKLTKNEMRLLPFFRKTQDFLKRTAHFINRTWNFEHENMKAVIKTMSEEDERFFQCDLSKFQLIPSFQTYMLGIRTYIAKEPLNNYNEAKKRYTVLRLVHYPVLLIYHSFLGCLLYLFLRVVGVTSLVQTIYNNFIALLNNVLSIFD